MMMLTLPPRLLLLDDADTHVRQYGDDDDDQQGATDGADGQLVLDYKDGEDSDDHDIQGGLFLAVQDSSIGDLVSQ